VAATLETFRTPDGGYGKSVGDRAGSTYHSFLVLLCYQLLGRDLPHAEKLKTFVDSRRREDGGYVEIAPMRRGGTNPTAAAVGILQILFPQEFRENLKSEPRMEHGLNTDSNPCSIRVPSVASFLAGMASLEGGLRANTRAPLADLLSTFTGAWTLDQLKALNQLDLNSVRSYVQALEMNSGGFRAGLWDNRADVEYTFYGLGVMSLLS
jgi:geranylgeranyl transferase type-2 subunit beta